MPNIIYKIMKKIVFIVIITVFIVFGVFAISFNISKKSKTNSKKIKIITTLFPLYDFAKNIGEDKVNVVLLLPPGVEAHDFELKPSDIVKINQADIFVYTGEFMEPWVDDIIKGVNKNVKIVDASVGVKLIKKEDKGIDPHIWLDFENSKIMAKNIADALEKTDQQNKNFYQNNFKKYQKKLDNLDKNYKNTLSTCKTKTIIYGGHYAFGYLVKKYNLDYLAAQGFSPDAEPTAKDLVSLINQIKKNKINYIFYEELSSPKIAETLSRETNTKLLILNGAHNLSKEDYHRGISYIFLMENNLKNLRKGLDCQ